MFKVASLFSGCGGGDLGLKGGFEFLGEHYKKLPFKTVYANEIDDKIAEIFSEILILIPMSGILELFMRMIFLNMIF